MNKKERKKIIYTETQHQQIEIIPAVAVYSLNMLRGVQQTRIPRLTTSRNDFV